MRQSQLIYTSIPAELTKLPQWVVWKTERLCGRQAKIPYNPQTGKRAKSNNSKTWGTFQEALHAMTDGGRFNGLGFVFSPDDPFIGIDLDKAVDDEGEIKPWAQELIKGMDSYTEFSPSGKGIHIIVRGKKSGRRCKAKYQDGEVEMYSHSRFFTVTGDSLDTPSKPIREQQDQLYRVYNLVLSKKELSQKEVENPEYKLVDFSDEELIEKAFNAKNGTKVKKLWAGDWIGDYPSRSEADLVLCCELAFWTGKDAERIDRLFRKSGLYREKWLNRADYREMTIKKAIEITRETWGGGRSEKRVVDLKQTNEHPPLDIFGDASIAGVPDWPEGACPAVINDFALDAAERLGVDPAMIAVPAIVVAAASITDVFKIQPKQFDTEWLESARLWCGMVADPGEKKTPAIEIAVKPLREIEAELSMEDKKRLEEYEIQLQEYEKSKKAKGNEKLPRPKRPTIRRKIVGDLTVEALHEILVGNSWGVLCVNDELSGWFGSFDAYRANKSAAKDRAAWLELYDGGPKHIDRIQRGNIFVPNWSACLLGGIQPGPMKRLVGKITDDGLLQRFIIFHGRRAGVGVDRVPNQKAISAYKVAINRLVRMKPLDGSEIIQLSPEAQKHRKRVEDFARMVMLLPDTSPAFKAHLSKWEGLYPRMLLTYHLIESAAKGEDEPPAYVSGETAARAASLLIDYLLPNAARFYLETLGGGNYLNDTRWIAGHILSKGIKEITARDIYRAYRTLRDDMVGINEAMNTLYGAGWVEPMKFGKKNMPSKWTVDPRVHEIFADRAAAERKRREEERQKIQEAVAFLKSTQSLAKQMKSVPNVT